MRPLWPPSRHYFHTAIIRSALMIAVQMDIRFTSSEWSTCKDYFIVDHLFSFFSKFFSVYSVSLWWLFFSVQQPCTIPPPHCTNSAARHYFPPGDEFPKREPSSLSNIPFWDITPPIVPPVILPYTHHHRNAYQKYCLLQYNVIRYIIIT